MAIPLASKFIAVIIANGYNIAFHLVSNKFYVLRNHQNEVQKASFCSYRDLSGNYV